jgi:hypothetical protein
MLGIYEYSQWRGSKNRKIFILKQKFHKETENIFCEEAAKSRKSALFWITSQRRSAREADFAARWWRNPGKPAISESPRNAEVPERPISLRGGRFHCMVAD